MSPSYCSNATSNGPTSSSGGAGAGAGGEGGGTENSRRYCPCCYCELFGNNGVSSNQSD